MLNGDEIRGAAVGREPEAEVKVTSVTPRTIDSTEGAFGNYPLLVGKKKRALDNKSSTLSRRNFYCMSCSGEKRHIPGCLQRFQHVK